MFGTDVPLSEVSDLVFFSPPCAVRARGKKPITDRLFTSHDRLSLADSRSHGKQSQCDQVSLGDQGARRQLIHGRTPIDGLPAIKACAIAVI